MIFLTKQVGQGMVEYALILMLVALVVLVVLALIGPQLGEVYSRIIVCVPPTAACTS